MRNFKNFYEELYNNPPETYSMFGWWGIVQWEDMIMEGLIQSYPIDNTMKGIKKVKIPNGDIKDVIKLNENEIGVVVNYFNSNLGPLINTIEKVLMPFGWHINNTRNINTNEYLLYVQTNRPFKLSPTQVEEAPFYHITHKKNLPKIIKNGLSPRDSQTSFGHPGGRIYLLQTNKSPDDELFFKLKNVLSSNKKKVSQKSDMDKYTKFEYRTGGWTADEMITLKVTIPEYVDVYEDPAFEKSKNFKAVFVTNNIPPQNIELIST